MFHLNLHISGYFHLVATCDLYNASLQPELVKSTYTNKQGEVVEYELPKGIYIARLTIANQITDVTIILNRNLHYIFGYSNEPNFDDGIFITPQLPLTTRLFAENFTWQSYLYDNNQGHSSREATMSFVFANIQNEANDFYIPYELMLVKANDLRTAGFSATFPYEFDLLNLRKRDFRERLEDRNLDRIINISLSKGDYFLIQVQKESYKIFPFKVTANEHHFCTFVYNDSILPESFRWLKHARKSAAFHYTDFLLIDILCNQLLWKIYTIKPSLKKYITQQGSRCHPSLKQLVKLMVQYDKRVKHTGRYKPGLFTTLFANAFASDLTNNFIDLKRIAVKYPALIKEKSIEDIISEGLQFDTIYTSFQLAKSDLYKLAYADTSLQKYRASNSSKIWPLLMILLKAPLLLFQRVVEVLSRTTLDRYYLKKIIPAEVHVFNGPPPFMEGTDNSRLSPISENVIWDTKPDLSAEQPDQLHSNWIQHMIDYLYINNPDLSIGEIARQLMVPPATVISNLRKVTPEIDRNISKIKSGMKYRRLLFYLLMLLICLGLITFIKNKPAPNIPKQPNRSSSTVDTPVTSVGPKITTDTVAQKPPPPKRTKGKAFHRPAVRSLSPTLTLIDHKSLDVPINIIKDDIGIQVNPPTDPRIPYFTNYDTTSGRKNDSKNDNPKKKDPFFKAIWETYKRLFLKTSDNPKNEKPNTN